MIIHVSNPAARHSCRFGLFACSSFSIGSCMRNRRQARCPDCPQSAGSSRSAAIVLVLQLQVQRFPPRNEPKPPHMSEAPPPRRPAGRGHVAPPTRVPERRRHTAALPSPLLPLLQSAPGPRRTNLRILRRPKPDAIPIPNITIARKRWSRSSDHCDLLPIRPRQASRGNAGKTPRKGAGRTVRRLPDILHLTLYFYRNDCSE